MRSDVVDLLRSDHPGLWVEIDVAMEALNVGKRTAYQIAKEDGWRTARGSYPRQYSFSDIYASWQKRKTTTPAPNRRGRLSRWTNRRLEP